MATKEQILKWNAQLSNGWRFDLRQFMFHKEKQIELIEEIDDKHYFEYTMYFWQKLNKTTWKYENYDVVINKSEWTRTEGGATSFGLGITKKIKEQITNKKSYKLLADLTKEYDLQKVKSLYTGNEVNPMS